MVNLENGSRIAVMLNAMAEVKRRKERRRITTWGLGAILVWVWFDLLVLIEGDRGLVG